MDLESFIPGARGVPTGLLFKHVNDILALGEGNGAIGSVSDDFNTKEKLGFTQVPQFERSSRTNLLERLKREVF